MNPDQLLHAAIQALTAYVQVADDPQDKQIAAECVQHLQQIAQQEQREPAQPPQGQPQGSSLAMQLRAMHQ